MNADTEDSPRDTLALGEQLLIALIGFVLAAAIAGGAFAFWYFRVESPLLSDMTDALRAQREQIAVEHRAVLDLQSQLAELGEVAAPSRTSDISQAEYYRAIFDLCIATGRTADVCMASVADFVAADWYGQPSPGWDWPALDGG